MVVINGYKPTLTERAPELDPELRLRMFQIPSIAAAFIPKKKPSPNTVSECVWSCTRGL